MSETPKKKNEIEREEEPSESESWSEDQKKREYYYDDAHGYEVYVPEEDKDRESKD